MTEALERRGGPHLRGAVAERHRIQRPLPPVPASARLARVTAVVACRAWRIPQACDAAALLASELVATALEHVPGRELTLRVLMTPRRLRVEVHEPTGALAERVACQEPDDQRLRLVAASSARWGIEAQGGGTQVFAELPLS